MKPIIPRQKPSSPPGILRTFLSLLLRGKLADGTRVREFEQAFADYLGLPHAIALSSARSGLYLTLKHFGIGIGDEVILPSLTAPIVPAVVIAAGARPVFVDSDPDTYLMSAAAVEAALRARFTPAMQRDKPVRVWISQTYRFKLAG